MRNSSQTEWKPCHPYTAAAGRMEHEWKKKKLMMNIEEEGKKEKKKNTLANI